MNVKLSYLYRDAGNYKQFGYAIFSNPNNLALPEIEQWIRAALIDGEFFIPAQWQVPSLHGYEWDDELDHEWHEFEAVTSSSAPATTHRTIDNFLAGVGQRQRVF